MSRQRLASIGYHSRPVPRPLVEGESVRVLFSSTSALGHVQPMLPLALVMRERGHDVVWATANDVRPRVEAAGVPTARSGRSAAELMGEYRRRWPEWNSLQGEALGDHMFPRLFGTVAAPKMFDDLLPLVHRWRPDLVVHEAAEFAAPVAAAALGVPHVAHSFGSILPAERVAAAGVETEPLWQSVSLQPRPYGGCYDDLYLDIYPPRMQRGDLSHIAQIQRLRPGALSRVNGDELPGAVAAALNQGQPVVYLTFGTVFHASAAFANAVAAVARLEDIVAVVTVGPAGDVEAFGPLPRHVHVARYIPQTDLLSSCSAVVSHAGSGTLLEALAHGLPQVCLPQAADQFRNAQACAGLGAGIALLGEEATTDAIATALHRALTDRELRRNAQRIGAEIAAMPTTDEVCSVLETLEGQPEHKSSQGARP